MPFPPPSAEFIVIAALYRTFLRRLPKSERAKFIRDVGGTLGRLQSLADIPAIDGTAARQAQMADACAQAIAWHARAEVVITRVL